MTSSSSQQKVLSHAALVRYARMLKFGDIHHRMDQKSGLQSIIAVHNTTRGPAIGGCRLYAYRSYNQALKDVLRLASMMTLKNAACGLPHGGAKAVIIKPHGDFDRKALFHAFGDFVNYLNGDYITSMDIGTTSDDMDFIAERTPHVIGSICTDAIQEDPSPYTAKGVFRGIEAAVKFVYQQSSLSGISVAMQGAGKVGYPLAKLLHQAGAKIIAYDTKQESVDRLINEFGARIVEPDELYSVNCEVFAPCALGGTLTTETAARLKAKIVAGSANNQLAHHKVATQLKERGILYVPDFIINAGGVIQAASVHDYHDLNIANQKIDKLYDHLYQLFVRAENHDLTPTEVAYQIAHENLKNVDANEVEAA